jgi:hypothetical protein
MISDSSVTRPAISALKYWSQSAFWNVMLNVRNVTYGLVFRCTIDERVGTKEASPPYRALTLYATNSTQRLVLCT